VPIIDATGIKTIREVYEDSKHQGTKLVLCEVNSEQVSKELQTARLVFAIGKANILPSVEEAIERGRQIIHETNILYEQSL
jgi:sulfate permease, SulP family